MLICETKRGMFFAAGWGCIFTNGLTILNGVTFLVALLEWGRTFRDICQFWDKKVLVSWDLKILRFAVKNGSCCCFNI